MKIIYYRVKSFFKQCFKVIRWVPIIYKTKNYDFYFALELFKKQLLETAKFLESDNAYTKEAPINAQKIKTFCKFMDKIYNDNYYENWVKIIEDKYGKWDLVFENGEDGTYNLNSKFEKNYTQEELKKIEEEIDKEIEKSWKIQKRAHKLLWEYLEHNIQNWWD